MANKISQLSELLAASITNYDNIRLGVDDLTSGVSKQIKLPELIKTSYPAYNILQYGADPTGVTECASNIQAAIDAAPDGSILVVPVGTYSIGTTLTLNKGLILQGMGRGHEGAGGAPTKGTSLKWTGSTNGTLLQINSAGAAATSVHGWVVKDIGFDGNGVAGANGIVVGTSADDSPVAAVGELGNVWLYNFGGNGLTCNTAQICHFHDVHASNCASSGFLWAAGTGNANTANLVVNCRASGCGIGFHLRRLVGGTFLNCDSESNQDEGYLLQTGGTNEAVTDLVFINCWQESNLISGGTGRGEFTTKSTNASIRNNLITIISHKSGSAPSAGNFCFKLDGAVVEMNRPRMVGSGQGILLDGGTAATNSHIRLITDLDPTNFVTYQAGTGAWYGTIEYLVINGAAHDTRSYVINNGTPFMWQQRHKDYLRLADTTANNVNKILRHTLPHYSNAEEDCAWVVPVCTSGSFLVQIGGGSGSYNSATSVDFYASSNNITLSGTKRASVTAGGIQLVDAHDLIIAATTGSKIGQSTSKLAFYGVTPITRQVLATGASHTVDDVITFLQTIGLCKQA